LFGFLSQTEPVGYVHTVAVRTSARRQGLAGELFGHFVAFARRHVKAIATANSSINSIGSVGISNHWPIRRPPVAWLRLRGTRDRGGPKNARVDGFCWRR